MFSNFSEAFAVLTEPRFWGFCCLLISMYFLTKGMIRCLWVILSPIGYIISKRTWKYLRRKYKIYFPLKFEKGGQFQASSVSNGKRMRMTTAYATAEGGDHASLTWWFLMTHNPFAVIEIMCHEYAHLYLGHTHRFIFSTKEAWNNEREADTFALYSMKNMPIFLKFLGIMFRGAGLYWNPYSKKELATPPSQIGSSGFKIQKSLYEAFGIDYRGVFKKSRYVSYSINNSYIFCCKQWKFNETKINKTD